MTETGLSNSRDEILAYFRAGFGAVTGYVFIVLSLPLFLGLPRVMIAADQPSDNSSSTLAELEILVGKWVDLRKELAEESRNWQEDRELLMTEIALLEKERAALDRELTKKSLSGKSRETERLELEREKESLTQLLASMAPALDRAEVNLRNWRRRIPPSLASGIESAFDRIPANHREAANIPVTQRLQLVAGLYEQVGKLQGNIHLVRELVDTGSGTRREVDVLYLGLARGFAVSHDNSWAAVGTPGEDGWTWDARPAIAAQIRNAQQVFDGRSGARLVELPLAAGEGRK